MEVTEWWHREVMPLKEFITHSFQEQGMPHHAGPRGETPGFVRRHEEWGRAWFRAFVVFSVGKARQRRINSLGLNSLNNVGGLWVLRWSLVVWFWPWVDSGQGKYWPGVWQLDKEGGWGYGLLGLHAKGTFAGEVSVILGIFWRGSLLPVTKAPQDVEIS